MYFGGSSFASSPFGDPGGVSVFVTVSGQRMNFAIGNVVFEGDAIVLPTGKRVNLSTGNVQVVLGQTVLVTGAELELANTGVDVISWNPIPPGASQVWVPIDPNNP
jgi:lipopolysaccharide assembly outer membrane protein LptD (OstA)